MPITDLIPWRRERETSTREEGERNPIVEFQRDMNRMFDEFFGRGFGLAPSNMEEGWTAFTPRVDVAETDKAIKVSAELPGLSEDNIEVNLSENVLTIRGEKKQEREERGESYYRSERTYGSFRRSIPLPADVKTEEADAVYKNGVLEITLPKTAEARRKKIAVKKE
ncbi:MAG: Hsp20/alpha crystallin family protein [Anaerolineae bacterium]